MLLFDIIEKDKFASGLSIFFVDYGSRDGCVEKHIEEDEYDPECIVVDVGVNRVDLVVRVGVVGGHHVSDKNHPVQVSVIFFVNIVGDIRRLMNYCASYNCEGDNNESIEEDIH